MPYLKIKDISLDQEPGHYRNPVFHNGYGSNWNDNHLIADYLGFTVKYDIHYQRLKITKSTDHIFGYKETSAAIAIPIFKKSRETFHFYSYHVNDLFNLTKVMKERNHITPEIEAAWLSFDSEKIEKAIMKQMKALLKTKVIKNQLINNEVYKHYKANSDKTKNYKDYVEEMSLLKEKYKK